MISRTAIESLDKLEHDGLHPTWEDAIRLNELGLRYEAARAKRVPDNMFALPRVAYVSDEVTFRQPTVGHELWIAKAERWIARGDEESSLSLHCFALSRPWDELPDPDHPAAVKGAVDSFLPAVRDFTRDQLRAAIRYAMYGAEPSVGVFAAHPENTEAPDGFDFDTCVAAGVLNKGRYVLYGHSVADMKAMTVRELTDVIRRAEIELGEFSFKAECDILEGDYYATVDAIEARLKGE